MWTRYLQIVDSFGPFGPESWMTVNISLSWLLDDFFLSQSSLSFSSAKFCRRWRLMNRLRKRFSALIVPCIIYTNPPRPAPPPSAVNTPVLAAVPPLELQIWSPPPSVLIFPPPPKTDKHKRRERRKRRMDFYRNYSRPTPPPPIQQTPLAMTMAPDVYQNRSAGSFNTRDPPV
jgi:hypothetical protein